MLDSHLPTCIENTYKNTYIFLSDFDYGHLNSMLKGRFCYDLCDRNMV